MIFVFTLSKQGLDKFRVTTSPLFINRYPQPTFLLKELEENQAAHEFLDVVADGFLWIGEFCELLHDESIRFALLSLFPFVGYLHHPLACDVENNVLILLFVSLEEHVADGIHGECFRQVFQRETAVTQFLELLNGSTASVTFAKQISETLGVSRFLLICAVFCKRPRLADVGETEYTLVLAIAKHKGSCIAIIAPGREQHVTDASAITLYIHAVCQFHFIDADGLFVTERDDAQPKGLLGKLAVG